MREDEARRIEQQLDFEPDRPDEGDCALGNWECEKCGFINSNMDPDCQSPVCDPVGTVFLTKKDRVTKQFLCSICSRLSDGWSCNAEPVNSGRCCKFCDDHIVIPARLNRLRLSLPLLEVELELGEDHGNLRKMP